MGSEFLRILSAVWSNMTSRSTIANTLMASFILFTGIGTFLINPIVGFITLGVVCGAVGYLLGME